MNVIREIEPEAAPVSVAPAEREGPVAQSVALGFRALLLAVGVLACAWAASGVRQVPPEARAVVTRFGAITAVDGPGLALAWPRPFGAVNLVPGAEAQLRLAIPALRPAAGLSDEFANARLEGATGSDVLTPDGVVFLDATLTYRVSDPRAYFVAGGHVAPALARAFRAAIATVAAGRALDDFLAFRAEAATGLASQGAGRAETAGAIRAAILGDMNARLDALGLGVEVTRLDLTAALPPAAKSAFDSVATATQVARQAIAGARKDATLIAQKADRDHDETLARAHARADEKIGAAKAESREARELAATPAMRDPATRAEAMADVYRRKLAPVMARIGEVIAVDPTGTGHLIVPGGASPGR